MIDHIATSDHGWARASIGEVKDVALRGLQTEGANRTTRSEGQIYPQFSVGCGGHQT